MKRKMKSKTFEAKILKIFKRKKKKILRGDSSFFESDVLIMISLTISSTEKLQKQKVISERRKALSMSVILQEF